MSLYFVCSALFSHDSMNPGDKCERCGCTYETEQEIKKVVQHIKESNKTAPMPVLSEEQIEDQILLDALRYFLRNADFGICSHHPRERVKESFEKLFKKNGCRL